MSSTPSSTYYHLLEACKKPGCPICRLSNDGVQRYLKSMFPERVNDIEIRAQLRNNLGYCSAHAEILLSTRIADLLGGSIIYDDILNIILKDLPGTLQAKKRRDKSRPSRDGCPACEREVEITGNLISELIKSLSDEKLREALQASDGLCFPHLRQLFSQIKNRDKVNFLLELTREHLETYRADIQEAIRKHDHEFQDEKISPEEASAWQKVMELVSGAQKKGSTK